MSIFSNIGTQLSFDFSNDDDLTWLDLEDDHKEYLLFNQLTPEKMPFWEWFYDWRK